MNFGFATKEYHVNLIYTQKIYILIHVYVTEVGQHNGIPKWYMKNLKFFYAEYR